MKIAGRGGHTKKATGSSLIIDELKENRLIFKSTEKYLKIAEVDIINVTPSENTPYPEELTYGIRQANNNCVDLFFSIHFNKAYDKKVKDAIGTEVWVYDKSFKEANAVLNNLVSLGFKNRGIKSMKKENRQLGELSNTNMPSMIIEVCFVESLTDCDLYKKLGHDLIGKVIAEGLIGKSINNTNKPSIDNISGTFIVKVDGLRVREKPSTKSKVVAQYYKNEKIKFDKRLTTEGFEWISYIGSSGKRRYVAFKEINSGKKFGEIK